MKKVLITGIDGFLGRYLAKTSDKNLYAIQGTTFHLENVNVGGDIPVQFMDISDHSAVNEVLSAVQPDIVIHTAGNSNVDVAERNPDKSYNTTVRGTWNIANWCKSNDCKLVYSSTNAIFSGDYAPYNELSIPRPVNVYGQHKYIAENIAAMVPFNLIFRIILLYGWNFDARMNPVTFVLEALKMGRELKMVNKASYTNPLYVQSVCEGIWKGITMEKNAEIYHLAGGETCDRYELALAVAEVFDLDKRLISPVPDSYYNSLAKRPYDTSYDMVKAIREIGFRPVNLKEGLLLMKEEISKK